MPYDQNESNEFYFYNSNEYGNHNGRTFLVLLALYDTSLAYKHIKSIDVDLHLLIWYFVSNLTRGQLSLFWLILDMVQDSSKRDTESLSHNKNDLYK